MKAFRHYAARLAGKLTPKRYRHSLAVAQTALALARTHQVQPGLAYLAGLLHDYARDLPNHLLVEVAKTAGLPPDPMKDAVPELWHGSVGAFLVEKELGLKHPALLQAIKDHILGSPAMTDLDKVVFLADMIEPHRDFPGVEVLRDLAFRNLDEAMLAAFDQSIRYLLTKRSLIHPLMIDARNGLLVTLNTEGR